MSGGQWAEVNGIALRYTLSGDNPNTIVLIHELGGTLETYQELVPLLSDRYQVLCYDMRGAGLSQKIRGVLDMQDLVLDIVGLLDHLRIERPVALAGCALGGAVALSFAAAQQKRTAAVIAMSPAVGIPPERRAAALARADEVEREGAAVNIDVRLLGGYPPELRDSNGRFEQLRARRMASDPFGFAAAMRMLADLDLAADFPRITCPTLVLAGKFDRDRPPEGVRATAAGILGAEFRILDSGHYMPVQTPSLLATEMRDFLSRSGH
jgi:3-oxoadipate enol-lactonase